MSTLPALPTRPLSAPATQQEKLDNQRFAMYVTAYTQATEERPACLTTAEGAAIARKYSTGGGRLAALTALVNARLAYWQSTVQRGAAPHTLTAEQMTDAAAFFLANGEALLPPEPPPAPPSAKPAPAQAKPTNGESQPAASAAPSFAAQSSPATWSVDYLDVAGWPCTLAITAASGSEAVARGRQIVKALKGQGAQPRPSASSGPAAQAQSADGAPGPAPMCGVHTDSPMTWRHKKNGGGGFWSCGQRLTNGEWCQYHPPQK